MKEMNIVIEIQSLYIGSSASQRLPNSTGTTNPIVYNSFKFLITEILIFGFLLLPNFSSHNGEYKVTFYIL